MKTKFNQKFYEDVLNYCTSIKNETHSLTYWEATVLRKLIHINFTKEVINYSNKHLAKMLFRPNGDKNVKNTIGKLIKKGFITSSNITISDGEEIFKRRTIKIEWTTIETIYNLLPNFPSKDDNDQDEKPLPKKEIKTQPVEKVKDVSDTKISKKKESVLEELKTNNEAYETTFINNAGKELKVNQEYIKFFNEVALKKTNNKHFYSQLEKATGNYTLNIVLQEWSDEHQQKNINYEIN